jgi:acetyltransferase-like isoleucine patch superfamily enzyme
MSDPFSNPLFKDLERLRSELDAYYLQQHQRVVPFTEALGNRWEKGKRLGFAEGANVHDLSFVIGDVKIGKNTYVGPFTFLDGTGGLTIGENCSISAGTQIYTHDSLKWALSGGKLGYDKSPVAIGNHCYIAPYTVIARGVTLGNNCVVGAHSLVNESFAKNSIIFGVPARKKGVVVIGEDGAVELNYD